MLGDTRAQGHAGLASKMMNEQIGLEKAKIEISSKVKKCQIDDTIFEDENGAQAQLRNRRVVDGLQTSIISSTKLLK